MRTGALAVFYSARGCELCAEARAELDSSEIAYRLVYVTASPEPGVLWLWPSDRPNDPEPCPRDRLPAVPALGVGGELYVGLEAIRRLAAR